MNNKTEVKTNKLSSKEPIKHSEKGITLVALIITIIILVILSAVSIIVVYRTKIVDYAIDGAQKYAAEGVNENRILEGTENLIGSTVDQINNILNGQKTDNDNGEEEESFTEEEKKELLGNTIQYTPQKAVESPETEGEKGPYIAQTKHTGDTKDVKIVTEDLSWKVWSIDDEKVKLISEKPTTTKLTLSKELGYNNGVKILNDICSWCYGNEELGSVARNLNLDDIESVLDKTVWKPEDDYYTNTSSYGKQVSSNGTGIYHMLTETCKNTNNLNFPYIWQYEAYSNIDGKKVMQEGLKNSEQTEFYETARASAKSYYELMYNGWYKQLQNNNFKDPVYEELILKDSNGNYYEKYYLSSRMTFPGIDPAWPSYVANNFLLASVYDRICWSGSKLRK